MLIGHQTFGPCIILLTRFYNMLVSILNSILLVSLTNLFNKILLNINFCFLYNRLIYITVPKLGINVPKMEATMTGGLVHEFDHAVLPSITPTVTFVLTFISMVPALVKLWNLCADGHYRGLSFIR